MIAVIVGGLGIVFGRKGLGQIDSGELPEALRGRATTGLYCSIGGLGLSVLTIAALLCLGCLVGGAIFLPAVLGSL